MTYVTLGELGIQPKNFTLSDKNNFWASCIASLNKRLYQTVFKSPPKMLELYGFIKRSLSRVSFYL